MTRTGIEKDTHCAQCGYNLRGLAPAGQCPECGHAIAKSLEIPALGDHDRRWLRLVWIGLGCVAIAGVGYAANELFFSLIGLFVPGGQFVGPTLAMVLTWISKIQRAFDGSSLLGIWLVSIAPIPRETEIPDMPGARRTLRIAALMLAAFIVYGISATFTSRNGWYFYLEPVSRMVVNFSFCLLIQRDLAVRARRMDLAWSAGALKWIVTGVSLFFLALSHIPWMVSFYRSMPINYSIRLIELASRIWAIVVLVKLGRLYRQATKSAPSLSWEGPPMQVDFSLWRGGVIERNIACRTCGYNLRGLAAPGVCPECGTDIEYSLRNWLESIDPRKTLLLGRGVSLAITAGILRMLLAVYWIAYAWNSLGQSYLPPAIIPIGLLMFDCIAFYYLTPLRSWHIRVSIPALVAGAIIFQMQYIPNGYEDTWHLLLEEAIFFAGISYFWFQEGNRIAATADERGLALWFAGLSALVPLTTVMFAMSGRFDTWKTRGMFFWLILWSNCALLVLNGIASRQFYRLWSQLTAMMQRAGIRR